VDHRTVAGVTLKTFRNIFGYTNAVLTRKPSRQSGQALRDLPIYSIPEAAAFLAIPRRTMHEWFLGPRRLFRPAGDYKSYSLLSFRDLSEAYMVYLLKEFHHLSMFTIRRSLESLRKESKSRKPLMNLDIKVFANSLLLDRPPRGTRGRMVVDLSHSRQLALGDVVDVFTKRILQDSKGQPLAIFPWRFFAQDHESRPVSIDPDVMSGNLVVFGTRVPVRILLGLTLAAKSHEEIAKSYRLDPDAVKKALLHFENPLQKVA
jgi:uncharacterized protein (DUF433 family)